MLTASITSIAHSPETDKRSHGKNLQTVVVTTTPQMHCASCENRIKGNIRFEKGVKDIVTSIPDQTVTITYDANQTNVGNILSGFRKFRYTARQLTPEELASVKAKHAAGKH